VLRAHPINRRQFMVRDINEIVARQQETTEFEHRATANTIVSAETQGSSLRIKDRIPMPLSGSGNVSTPNERIVVLGPFYTSLGTEIHNNIAREVVNSKPQGHSDHSARHK
jgi:hypothetical protein